MNRKLFIIGIRYAPVMLLLTCSIKIYMRYSMCTEVTIVNWINLMLDLILLGLIYIQGIELNFCYLHKSLCRTAMWGYIYYGAFLVSAPPKEEVSHIIELYLVLTIVMLIIYEVLRKHNANTWCY